MSTLRELIPSGLAARTAKKIRHSINCWERMGGSLLVCDITTDSVATARNNGVNAGLANRTIESVIADIIGLLPFAVDVGKKLRATVRCKPVPKLAEIAKIYEIADQSDFPSRLRGDDWKWRDIPAELRAVWLRGVLVLGVWTGLRLGDLFRFGWDSITDDAIRWEASKTSKMHAFPISAVVQSHIDELKAFQRSTVLAVSPTCAHLVRSELRRLSEIAGVYPAITPQALRRASVTTWATVSPEAGRIIHGTGLGVLRHYYDGEQILRASMNRFPWPAVMLPEDQRDELVRSQSELMSFTSRMSPERIEDLLRIARALV